MGTTDDRAAGTVYAEVLTGLGRLLEAQPAADVRVTIIEVRGASGVRPPTTTVAAPKPTDGGAVIRPKWNVQGHAVIAMLAKEVLRRESPKKHTALQALMSSDPLQRADDIGELAQWPDRIKGPKPQDAANIRDFAKFGEQRKVDHYVNYPYERSAPSAGLPDHTIGKGRLLDALKEWGSQLQHETDPQNRVTALAFMLHLIGDIHQPLHCSALVDAELFTGDEGDQGGNLLWWGSSQTLHGYYDGAVARTPDDITRRFAELEANLDRGDFASELTLKSYVEWAGESFALAVEGYEKFFAASPYIGPCTRVDRRHREVSGQLYESPDASFGGYVRDLLRNRARLAAFRLADTLAQAL